MRRIAWHHHECDLLFIARAVAGKGCCDIRSLYRGKEVFARLDDAIAIALNDRYKLFDAIEAAHVGAHTTREVKVPKQSATDRMLIKAAANSLCVQRALGFDHLRNHIVKRGGAVVNKGVEETSVDVLLQMLGRTKHVLFLDLKREELMEEQLPVDGHALNIQVLMN